MLKTILISTMLICGFQLLQDYGFRSANQTAVLPSLGYLVVGAIAAILYAATIF